MALTAVLVVAVMAGLLAISMRDGFSQYLLRSEIARFDALVQSLSDLHANDAAGWAELAESPRAFAKLVRDHVERPRGFRPPPPPPPPPKRPPDGRKPPPPPPGGPPDRTQLLDRLSLRDARGGLVAGHTPASSGYVERAVLSGEDGSDVIGWIRLAAPEGARNATDAYFLEGQYRSLALASLAAIALSALAAFLLARQLLSPIAALEAGAKTLAAGDYGHRLPKDRNDELGDLIGHFNQLAANLEAARTAERQWMSDTSHELQTPLATLRAEIESFQDGVRKPDAHAIDEMHAAILRLSKLVQDLSTLSVTREGNVVAAMSLVDIGQLAEDAAEALATRLQAAGLELLIESDGPAVVSGDPERLRQVVDNLLENALRYTDAGGKVQITVDHDSSMVRLVIEDTAPAPPAEAMPLLFDRFYRAEASRSRQHGGSGLGLAICKAIVAAHGGTIAAAPSPLGGLRIDVTLLRSPRPAV